MAEQINWPRLPAPKDFEQMVDMVLPAGYSSSEQLAESSSAERAQIYKILSGERAGRDRYLRKIPGAKSPPRGSGSEKIPPVQGGECFRGDSSSPSCQWDWRAPPSSSGSDQLVLGGLRWRLQGRAFWRQSCGDPHWLSNTQLAKELAGRRKTARNETP